MGITGSLKNSVENSVISVVLRHGFPVIAEGMENPALAEHGYGHRAWKDSTTEQHVKGGYRQVPGTVRSEYVAGCGWVMRNMEIVKDELDEQTGKQTVEVSGLTCTCGIIANKVIRYTQDAHKMLQQVSTEMGRTAFA